MLKNVLLIGGVLLLNYSLMAQCPGCITNLPPDLPEDTIYLSQAPDGIVGQYYDGDLSFRMPQTTTPVSETDPDTPPGLDISELTISSVSNLPPGLSWEASQTVFNPDDTDGCGKICGTPLLPGLYEVEVIVTATVIIVEETSSFTFPILILPGSSVTDGFTLENGVGCGAVAPVVTNNVISGGLEGFEYFWDFGNGFTSTLESPETPVYNEPGVYEIQYEAIIDTFGYLLNEVTVESAGCDDIFGGAPDLQVEIYDQDGERIFVTPIDDNSSFPVTFNIDLFLENSIYEIRILDDDQGLDGADDDCGSVFITQTSDSIQTNGALNLLIDIIHPVDTVRSVDTVIVYEQPADPLVEGIPTGIICEGDTVFFSTGYDTLTQWYQDTMPILGANGATFETIESGIYWVTYSSPDGCTATSDTIDLVIPALPDVPVFQNFDNLLTLFDEEALPANYSLQWYIDGNFIVGAEETEYCINEDGSYTLIVTDEDSGCDRFYTLEAVYDPAFPNCMPTSTDEAYQSPWRIYPNPASDLVWIEGERPYENALIMLYHSNGTLAKTYTQSLHEPVSVADLPAGSYFLKLQTQQGQYWHKLIVQ